MPIVWYSPKPLENGLASWLAEYLLLIKASIPSQARSIERPTVTLEKADITNNLICFWLYTKKEWENFKKAQEKEKGLRGKGRSWGPFWIAFRKEEFKESISKFTEEEIKQGRRELESLVGFCTYSYYREELRKMGLS